VVGAGFVDAAVVSAAVVGAAGATVGATTQTQLTSSIIYPGAHASQNPGSVQLAQYSGFGS